MSKQFNIEDLLKDKINHQEFEIQEDWLGNMSEQLDDFNKEPKKKKGILFLFLGLLLLVATLFTISDLSKDTTTKELAENTTKLTQENNNTADSKTKQELIEESNRNHSDFTTQKKKDSICELNELNALKDGNITHEYSKEENQIISSNKNKQTTISHGSISDKSNILVSKEKIQIHNNQNNKFEEEQVSKANTNTIINNSNTNNTVKKNNDDTNNTQNNKSVVKGITEKEIFDKEIIRTQKMMLREKEVVNTAQTEIENQKVSENTVNQSDLKVLTNVKNNVTIGSEDFSEKTEDVLQEKIINVDSTLILNDSLIVENKNAVNKKDSVNKFKSKNKELGISLAIKAGASILFRNLESIIEKRNREESNITTWNVGLEVNKTFKNNLIVGTGVFYANYGEKINYSAIEYLVKDSTFQQELNDYLGITLTRKQGVYTFDTTAFQQYDTILSINEKVVKDKSVQEQNGNTNFSYIEIPVQVGYKILDTKRIDFSVLTGVSIGFLTESKGYYIDNVNHLQKADNTKVMYNYLLSANLMYNLYKNIHLTLSPQFKYNLNNMDASKVSTRSYGAFNVNGGIVVDL